MQSLTLESKSFDVAVTKEFHGVSVPWEVLSYVDDFDNAQNSGGFFDLSHWGVIEIIGPAASDYLNRMSTQNFVTFDANLEVPGGFLTGRAGVVSLGFFQKVQDGFHYLVPTNQAAIALEHIEKFHFGEKFTATDRSGEYVLFGLWKPFADLKMDLEFPAVGMSPLRIEFRRWRNASIDIWQDNRRSDLYFVKTRRAEAGIFLNSMKKLGVPLLGQRLFEYFRLKAGVPLAGTEIGVDDIALEANFDEAIARNKGCYPGQEVVERIFTYGSVNRKLLCVEIDRDESVSFPPIPCDLHAEEKPKIGRLVAFEEDPEDPQRALGLAYVQKEFWNYEGDFLSSDGVVVRIVELDESSI